jgi:uncharacterized membrane protein YidH (DUF202 family)
MGATVETAVAAPAAPVRPDFQIVPRKGLVLVGVAVVLLIVAIAVNDTWFLMFLHVSGGAAWTIIDLFLGLVLGPIMGRMSIPARIEFTTKLMPKVLLIMPTVVTADPLHGWVVASFIVVGVMSVLALGLLEPANIAVLIELKKPRPNPAVIERLMKRFMYCAGVLGVMQIATLVIMTKLGSG